MLRHRKLQAQTELLSDVAIPHCCACTLLKERGTDAGQAARGVNTCATMLDKHEDYAM